MTLAKKYKLWVVEDAACGFGAKFNSKHVGSFGNIIALVLHPLRKIITTGEGGMITTNDSDSSNKITINARLWAGRYGL